MEQFLDDKHPGQVDIPEVQNIKQRIREAEAVSGIETFGMSKEHACFLKLPFYQTGKVRKDPIGPEDVRITLELLEDHKPELVFVAGDLSDPHGTHRMCLEAVMRALDEYSGEAPEVWYYRGAWQEWPVSEADVLVPLSEEELRTKILAIYKHQSQKDKAPFPGQDDREFWQRVEERNTGTARIVDRLGLPEYFAMEAYVVRRNGRPLEVETVPTSALGDTSRRRRASDFPGAGAGSQPWLQGDAAEVGEAGGQGDALTGCLTRSSQGWTAAGPSPRSCWPTRAGTELARVSGAAGLVDPRHPEHSAEVIAQLVRMASAQAGLSAPPAALCAGLAGVGNEAERVAVEQALAGTARVVRVVSSDGEIALHGAFGGGPGVLLIAGTGSVAYGRGPDGRMDRCGGWGMFVGDEGSGYALGRAALAAALRSVDGREAETRLLPAHPGPAEAGRPPRHSALGRARRQGRHRVARAARAGAGGRGRRGGAAGGGAPGGGAGQPRDGAGAPAGALARRRAGRLSWRRAAQRASTPRWWTATWPRTPTATRSSPRRRTRCTARSPTPAAS